MLEALVGEEFGGANLAHEPPVRARLRKDNGATSIADVGSRDVLRAACKHFVEGMEDVCGHGGRGNDENGHSAEAKRHEGAIGFAQARKCLMGKVSQLKQVPNDGEPRRAWRHGAPPPHAEA